MDKLHRKHGLAHTGPTDNADLAAFYERCEEIDNLNAGFQDLWSVCREVCFACRGPEDVARRFALYHRAAINWQPQRVNHAANHCFPHWDFDTFTRARNLHAFLHPTIGLNVQAQRYVAVLQTINEQRCVSSLDNNYFLDLGHVIVKHYRDEYVFY